MYQSVSDKVADVGLVMMVAGMEKNKAINTVNENKEKILKVLEQLSKTEDKTAAGFNPIEKAKTLLGPVLFAAFVSLFGTSAFADSAAADTVLLQLRKAPLTVETSESVQQEIEDNAKKDVAKDIAAVKDTIENIDPGQSTSGAVSIAGKKFYFDNEGQAKILGQIAKLDNKLKLTQAPNRDKVVTDLINSVHLPTRSA
jgi:hypothetical protein